MNILMVMTSHDTLGNTGRKTGFWLEEFCAPYYTFLDVGANITVASPKKAVNRRSTPKAMPPKGKPSLRADLKMIPKHRR
jgi:putative intracellular protease/amidase